MGIFMLKYINNINNKLYIVASRLEVDGQVLEPIRCSSCNHVSNMHIIKRKQRVDFINQQLIFHYAVRKLGGRGGIINPLIHFIIVAEMLV